MRTKYYVALVLATLVSASAYADKAPENAPESVPEETPAAAPEKEHSGSHIVLKRANAEEKAILSNARADENKPAPAPTFVVKTNDNNFMFTVGGSITPIIGYDIGNNLYKQDDAGISFVTSAIPVPAQKGKKSDYYINPLNGFVYMQIMGLQGTKNEISGFIKLGTNGISPSIVLQRAYVTWRNFTAGQKLTLMQDAYACQPPTIDPEGPSGCVSAVAYEVGYTSKSYKGFRFAVALDMPTFYSSNGYYRGHDYPDYDGHQVYDNAEQLIPDVPAWIEYQHSQWNRIRFSALLRNYAYRDLIDNKTHHKSGWGVMLSGNFQPVKPVIFYYQLAYGHGIGSYLQDIAGKPISFIPDPKKVGEVKASPMMGANIGVTFNVTPKLQFNAMFSESRIWEVQDYCQSLDASQNYKYALYGAVNMFYNITPYLQWGVEYLWGRRQTWNLGGANDNRIQTQIAFNF